MAGVSNLKEAENRLKTCENYILQGNLWPAFVYSQGYLFIDFLIEQRTINTAHYSYLLKDRVKPTFF